MRISAILLSLLLLSGCTALVVGGTADGGYRTGKYERPGSVVASDSAITNRIQARFVADPVVSMFNIGVRTWDGTVTLSGTVGSYVARNQAVDLAKHTNGVKAVNNQIIVEDKSK